MSDLEMTMPRNDIDKIVASHQSWLRNFIRKRVPSAEDAEDILQEVFYQLVKMDSMDKHVEQVTAWLFRVTRNKIINWQVKKREESFPLLFNNGEEDEIIFKDFADILFDGKHELSPEMEYLRALVWEEIEIALLELPAEQRDIFEQTEFLGLPVKEISEAIGVPVNTLLSRKHYAVKYLRKRLKTLYAELLLQ